MPAEVDQVYETPKGVQIRVVDLVYKGLEDEVWVTVREAKDTMSSLILESDLLEKCKLVYSRDSNG